MCTLFCGLHLLCLRVLKVIGIIKPQWFIGLMMYIPYKNHWKSSYSQASPKLAYMTVISCVGRLKSIYYAFKFSNCNQIYQNSPLTHTMAKINFHRQWTAPSINYITNYQYTTAKIMLIGLLLLRLVSEACPMSTSALVSIECHRLACMGSHLTKITTQLVDDIGYGFIFCDSLNAIGPPCGPFQLENYRAQLLPTTSWLLATCHSPPLYNCLWCW